MFQCYSLKSSRLLFPLSPEICSLHLWLSKAHLNHLIFTRLRLLKPYFQIRMHSQEPGMKTSTYLSGVHRCSPFLCLGFFSMPWYSHGSPEGHQCQVQWLSSAPSLVAALQYLSWLPFLSFLNPSAELVSRYSAQAWLLPSSIVLCIYLLLSFPSLPLSTSRCILMLGPWSYSLLSTHCLLWPLPNLHASVPSSKY